VPEPSEKWTEVWGHLYLGMIFDLLGQRERAVNEYSKAKQTNDNTGGAQGTIERYLKKPCCSDAGSQNGAQAASTAKPTGEAAPAAPAADDGRPHLKKPQP